MSRPRRPWRKWQPDELKGLKRLYLSPREYGDVKAFAESIDRDQNSVRKKWVELRDTHPPYPPCAAMIDDGPETVSYRKRMTRLLGEEPAIVPAKKVL